MVFMYTVNALIHGWWEKSRSLFGMRLRILTIENGFAVQS
jgi:hypothetical protein